MLIECIFWLAAGCVLFVHQRAAAFACAGAALVASTGVAFGIQLAVAAALVVAFLLIAHGTRAAAPTVRISRSIPERTFELGTVREVTSEGAKRLCLVETGGRLLRGVAACYEPIRAGDAVRLIGETDEGVIVQMLTRR